MKHLRVFTCLGLVLAVMAGGCDSGSSGEDCEPGEARCASSGNLETCNADGNAWLETVCDDGCAVRDGAAACVSDECTDECDTVDVTQCSGVVIQTCTLGADGCNDWVDGTDCSTTAEPYCDDSTGTATCSATCADLCDTLDATQCNGDVIETCTANAIDTCNGWVAGTDCSATSETCDDSSGTAACVAACSDDCDTVDATQCSGTVIETCTVGADGCNDWVAGTDCADTSESCDASSGTATCVSGCTNDCDTIDATQCNGTMIETCTLGADGCNDWVAGTDCDDTSEACDDSGGAAVCVCVNECNTLDATQCNGTIIQTCTVGADSCNDWVDGLDCDGTADPYCVDTTGDAVCSATCADECDTVDATQCSGNVIETCTVGADNCNDWVPGDDCSDSGTVCDDTGADAICVCISDCLTEDETQCSGTVIETCTMGGEGCLMWTAGVDCGATGASCDDSGEPAVCSGGCNSNCMEIGETRCTATTIDTCADINGDGTCLQWEAGLDCGLTGESCDDSVEPAICTDAPCYNQCAAADDTRCFGSIIQTCTMGGNGCLDWVFTSDCNDNPPNTSCSDASGTPTCTDVCISTCDFEVPGYTTCYQGSQISVCTQNGACQNWETDFDCAEINGLCTEISGSPACAVLGACPDPNDAAEDADTILINDTVLALGSLCLDDNAEDMYTITVPAMTTVAVGLWVDAALVTDAVGVWLFSDAGFANQLDGGLVNGDPAEYEFALSNATDVPAHYYVKVLNDDFTEDVIYSLTFLFFQMEATGIFFSEYVEGSSNDKALEIYNGTQADFDLCNCEIHVYANGRGFVRGPNNHPDLCLDPPQAPLALEDVWVICQNQASEDLQPYCDQNGGINYNGDDTVILFCNGVIYDVIGRINEDLGSWWGDCPVDLCTRDKTLSRLCNVTEGDPISTDEFNAAYIGAQWEGFNRDYFDGLGAHCP